VQEVPSSADLHGQLARAYCLLGMKDKAISTAQHAIELEPVSVDAMTGSDHIRTLASVYAWTGEHDLAIKQLDSVLFQIPTMWSSTKWLKIAPEFIPLRDSPKFQALLEKYR
jgi:hypothetical protein